MSRYTKSYREIVTVEHDCCEHLKVGQRAALTYWEHDRFGPLSAISHCHDCAYKKDEQYRNDWDEEEGERLDEEAWLATLDPAPSE